MNLTIGLIGAGGITHVHIPAWLALGARVTVFSLEGAAAVAAKYGIGVADSLEELLNGCDVVDICTPTPTHRGLAELALRAGKHVICEKPIALTKADADALAELAASVDRQLHPAHVVRYFAEYALAQAAVAAGQIGEVAILRFSRIGEFPTWSAWFADEAQSGGIVMDQMIHDLDIARWIAGEVTEVYAVKSAAGAAVLCEKPLATTLTDALAMQAACDAASVTLLTAYPVRFSPAFARLRELVAAGGLGALLAATGTNNGQIPVGDRAWFTDPLLSGGGAMVDHIVHVADLLDALTGFTPEFVRAVSNRILHADKPEVRAETGGLVTISYAGGFVATIDCSWSQPDHAPTWGGLTLQVVGTAGIADIDPFAQHVGGVGSDDALLLGYGTNTDELLLAEFLQAVRTGRAPQPDGAAGIRSLKIVLAAQQSARTGEVVPVN